MSLPQAYVSLRPRRVREFGLAAWLGPLCRAYSRPAAACTVFRPQPGATGARRLGSCSAAADRGGI